MVSILYSLFQHLSGGVLKKKTITESKVIILIVCTYNDIFSGCLTVHLTDISIHHMKLQLAMIFKI